MEYCQSELSLTWSLMVPVSPNCSLDSSLQSLRSMDNSIFRFEGTLVLHLVSVVCSFTSNVLGGVESSKESLTYLLQNPGKGMFIIFVVILGLQEEPSVLLSVERRSYWMHIPAATMSTFFHVVVSAALL